jgi:MFS family permease
MLIAAARYRDVLRIGSFREALLLGVAFRLPFFAAWPVLTLHVVGPLHLGYAYAGALVATLTAAVSVGGPLRGRLLDRRGLRPVVLPTLIVTGVCWSIAPFTGFAVLLALVALTGIFYIPTFPIVRQAIIRATPEAERRTALSLEAAIVELTYTIAPVIGVWAATTWNTRWVLLVLQMTCVAAGAAVWIVNPDIGHADPNGPARTHRTRDILTVPFVVVCLVTAATAVIVSGTDISLVAALRGIQASSWIGPVLAAWGFGSMLGGLLYGARHKPIPAHYLLGVLALATLPLVLPPRVWSLAALVVVAGLFCASTITATVDQLATAIPEEARNEAIS